MRSDYQEYLENLKILTESIKKDPEVESINKRYYEIMNYSASDNDFPLATRAVLYLSLDIDISSWLPIFDQLKDHKDELEKFERLVNKYHETKEASVARQIRNEMINLINEAYEETDGILLSTKLRGNCK